MRRSPILAVGAAILAVAAPAALAQGLFQGVPNANPKAGHPPNVLASGFTLHPITEGSRQLENPTSVFDTFGFLNDAGAPNIEATKTEPDQNTYLTLNNPGGPTPGYNYGRHFLFQGHEAENDHAYVTRINLDVKDPTHRVTLLTPGNGSTTGFNDLDGSTWDPFAQTMIYTQEDGSDGGAISQSPFWNSTTPPAVTSLDGSFGKGGFEGIHPDAKGDVYIVEDSGGQTVPIDPNNAASSKTAKQPNSYVYRFVPDNPSDLTHGKLQVLQVTVDGTPLTETCTPTPAVHPTSCPSTQAQASADVFSQAQLDLHSGNSFPAKFVTIHDTHTDGTAPFDANQAAKGINNHGAGAVGTPFQRPENGSFQPDTGFTNFFFVATGDTDSHPAANPALVARGTWGSIFRLHLQVDGGMTGNVKQFALGDADHASFDNTTFADDNTLLVAEDRGDGLHTQLNKLDSVWAYRVNKPPSQAQRLIALGRDPASEADSILGSVTLPPGFTFQNEGDNEPTGVFVSDGSAAKNGLLGTKAPNPGKARTFFTQQHGENHVWEITPTP